MSASHAAPSEPRITPLEDGIDGRPPAPWRLVGLKNGTTPTAFTASEVEGVRALRLQTNRSYANWVHPWTSDARTLSWQWRLDQPLASADLRAKATDDAALKVCIFFDLPLARLPWGERTLLKIARSASGEVLPAATLCYVWDTQLTVGTALPNAYTRRLRYLVVDSETSPLRTWRTHRRDIATDFKRAFPEEADAMPPVSGIEVGADADNTNGNSLGYVRALTVTP